MTKKNILGDVESIIGNHYANQDLGIPASKTVIPVSKNDASVNESFITLTFREENGHRNFDLASTGVAADIQGIIAELKHVLGHLENDNIPVN